MSTPTPSPAPSDDPRAAPLTVRRLRGRWKPVKEGPAAAAAHEPIRIRLHRCFSWMQRAEHVAASDDADAALDAILLYRWTALNALYGRWDRERREPMGDRQTLSAFGDRILAADADGRIPAMLATNRGLLEKLVGNRFLMRHYWAEPEFDAVRTTRSAERKIREALREQRHPRVLFDVLQRVYFLRCQLVHGAATFNGRQNRTPVRHAARFLELLLPEVALVVIDHAWTQDWDDLCYPPAG